MPFEAMPHAIDPPRGWLATANNRLAGDDYPYPLYGTWISGYRAVRIRADDRSRDWPDVQADDKRTSRSMTSATCTRTRSRCGP